MRYMLSVDTFVSLDSKVLAERGASVWNPIHLKTSFVFETDCIIPFVSNLLFDIFYHNHCRTQIPCKKFLLTKLFQFSQLLNNVNNKYFNLSHMLFGTFERGTHFPLCISISHGFLMDCFPFQIKTFLQMYYSPVSADSLWVLIFNFSYPGMQHYEKLQLSFHTH